MIKEMQISLSEEVVNYIEKRAKKENKTFNSMLQNLIIEEMVKDESYDTLTDTFN